MFSRSDADALSAVAREYGIKPSAFLALGLKESGGRPMWNVNGLDRPAIRFEGHYFFRYLKETSGLAIAVELGLANEVVPTGQSVERALEIAHDMCERSSRYLEYHKERMFQSLGYRVLALKRVRIGNLSLGDLKEGEVRQLSSKEVQGLLVTKPGR